jgi:hypothetical protein
MLVNRSLADAEKSGMAGAAVMTSNGSWMANSNLFLKCGFERVEEKNRFELLVKKFGDAPSPSFLDWEQNAEKQYGLELSYSHQCPANAKALQDIHVAASEAGIPLEFTEYRTSLDGQAAPTGFGVFQLIKDGKVLADHYISGTRFKNILKAEKLV